MSVSCECCVLSGRSLCFRLITRAEASYRLCEGDHESLIMGRPSPTGVCCAIVKKKSHSVTTSARDLDDMSGNLSSAFENKYINIVYINGQLIALFIIFF